MVENSLLSPTRLRETFGSCESTETSEPALLGRRGMDGSVILQCKSLVSLGLFGDSLVVFDKPRRERGEGEGSMSVAFECRTQRRS